jgi:hypothetical protein
MLPALAAKAKVCSLAPRLPSGSFQDAPQPFQGASRKLAWADSFPKDEVGTSADQMGGEAPREKVSYYCQKIIHSANIVEQMG